MANMLRQSLTMQLPEVLRCHGALLFQVAAPGEPEALVLFLYINFSVLNRNIHGYIAMLLDLPSMGALKILVRDFIAQVMDDNAPRMH
jgi:chemotaxis protein CheC